MDVSTVYLSHYNTVIRPLYLSTFLCCCAQYTFYVGNVHYLQFETVDHVEIVDNVDKIHAIHGFHAIHRFDLPI